MKETTRTRIVGSYLRRNETRTFYPGTDERSKPGSIHGTETLRFSVTWETPAWEILTVFILVQIRSVLCLFLAVILEASQQTSKLEGFLEGWTLVMLLSLLV